MVNIQQIAKETGFSIATVSRALNDQRWVSENTKDVIKKKALELGYTPNINAVRLKRARTNIIGLVIPSELEIFNELQWSIVRTALLNEYQVLLLPTYFTKETEMSYLEIGQQHAMDGLILTSTSLDVDDLVEAIEKISPLTKIVATEKVQNKRITNIYPDRRFVYDSVINKIVELGYKEILYTKLRSSEVSDSSRKKDEIFKLYKGRAPIKNYDYFDNIVTYEDGYKVANEIMSNRSVFPDFVSANSDDVAAGICKGFSDLGGRLHVDFDLIGEGNLSYSKLMNFSTIDFQQQRIGEEAVNYITSGSADTMSRSFEPNVIYRGPLSE